MSSYNKDQLTTKQMALEQVQRILESSGKALENGGRNIHEIRNQVRMLDAYMTPHKTMDYKTNKKKFKKLVDNTTIEEPLDEFNLVLTHFSILMELLSELRWLDYVRNVDDVSEINPVIGED